ARGPSGVGLEAWSGSGVSWPARASLLTESTGRVLKFGSRSLMTRRGLTSTAPAGTTDTQATTTATSVSTPTNSPILCLDRFMGRGLLALQGTASPGPNPPRCRPAGPTTTRHDRLRA